MFENKERLLTENHGKTVFLSMAVEGLDQKMSDISAM
jgi:hypothetical protein